MRPVLFAALFLGCALAAGGQAVITGDYIEDRANKVYGCYCEWSGEGEHNGREAVLGWSIRSGSFRGVALEGVKFAVVILGERTLSRGKTPRQTILFLDREATPAQRDAAEALVRREYAALVGKVVGVHVAAIEFERSADKAALRIGEEVNLEMRKARLPEDALQGAILWYDPLIPLEESTLGTTLNVKYDGPDLGHRWNVSDPAVTGYYGGFALKAIK